MRPLLLALCASVLVGAEVHRVTGESYYHTFSAAHPVLKRVRPGDTIVTKTVDSAGFDYQGTRRTKTHGNPLTGAFYVEGAEPGDTLVVHLRKIRLNRASGYTGHRAGVKSLPTALEPPKPAPDAVYKGYDYLVPWQIDVARKTVSNGRLTFAAEPMLGCIGVAPEGDFSPRSGPAGYWGGNLDYRLVREGNTVMLPVFHAGALLFFGDGHAVQGDGEAVGSGVETSLDVEVQVELRKGQKLNGPRLETASEIVSIGATHEAPALDRTVEMATADMLAWLVNGFGLTPAEAHLTIGTQARYDIITLHGSVGLRISKLALRQVSEVGSRRPKSGQ